MVDYCMKRVAHTNPHEAVKTTVYLNIQDEKDTKEERVFYLMAN